MKNPVFVLAPDSFKESMTAKEVCIAMEKGIKKALPEAVCIQVPMADGGEGTVQSLVDATEGNIYYQTVTGPLGQPVTAHFVKNFYVHGGYDCFCRKWTLFKIRSDDNGDSPNSDI